MRVIKDWSATANDNFVRFPKYVEDTKPRPRGLSARVSRDTTDVLRLFHDAFPIRVHGKSDQTMFVTFRHLTARTKGWVTRKSLVHIWFNLVGCPDLTKLIADITFVNGKEFQQANWVTTRFRVIHQM